MKEYVTDFDQLHESMMKCKKNVSWKPSVKSFILNSEENLHRMEDQLKRGTWKNGKPKTIEIKYPKKREGLSIPFRDRVYQRSINDNALYPQMSKHFVYANCACQKGKGTDFTRKLVKKYLWNYYCHFGNHGYVLQIDIHGYYLNMRHDKVGDCFKKGVDRETHEMSMNVLDDQYCGDIGYNPGSQMVQIAGISLLDELDHYIKERLHAKYYIRYMDDLWILWNDEEEIEHWFEVITEKLYQLGFELNEKKSKIKRLSKGFLFLGFYYRMTETGKIIMTLNSENVKHERKKLRRMENKFKKGEMERSKIDECFKCWKNNAENGNSYQLIRRTEQYLCDLRKGDTKNGSQANHTESCRAGG
nr:MAG TPA: group II intron reverse transcriptase/maturase [Caudoviricetes sp.]